MTMKMEKRGETEATMEEFDFTVQAILVIVGGLLLILLICSLAMMLNDFTRELQYLNNEINRTTGEDKEYWIRRRRRLWLSLIPFVKY